MQIPSKPIRLTGLFLSLLMVSGTLFSQEIQVNLNDPGKIKPISNAPTSTSLNSGSKSAKWEASTEASVVKNDAGENASPEKLNALPLIPPGQPYTEAKQDRTIRLVEEIPAIKAGNIKTLAVIDRIIQVDTGELPAVIWSDLNITQSYFLQEALRTSISDSTEWNRLEYYGWSLLNPDDDYLSNYGEYYLGFFDSIQTWLTQKSESQRNRLKQITLLSERNYTPSYISDWGNPDLQTSQMLGMWLHYIEKNQLNSFGTALTPAEISDVQIHYESLRAFWKSQLWMDSVKYYKELKGEDDDEFTFSSSYNEETSFDAISAYYKFVLLNPLKINWKWRNSATPNWNDYRLLQMWEASCKLASNSSKFTEIADKLNNDLYSQKEFKQLIAQSENSITISNLNLSKDWSTVKSDDSKIASIYVVLRYLDYDKSEIPFQLPYGYLLKNYFSELPYSVWNKMANSESEDSLVESTKSPLIWQDFDVFNSKNNEITLEKYRIAADSAILMDTTAAMDTAMASMDTPASMVYTVPHVSYDENSNSTRYRRQTQWGVGASYMQIFKSQSALNSTINKTLSSYGIAPLSQLSAVGFEAWITPDNTMSGFSYHVNNGLVSGLNDELKSPAEYTSRYIGFSSGGIFKRRFYEFGSGGTYGHFVQRIVMPQTATGTYVFNAKRTEVVENKSFVYGIYVESKLKLKYLYLKVHGGYQWDFSDRRWQFRDQYINSSDRFSVSSFYASVSAGILFNQH